MKATHLNNIILFSSLSLLLISCGTNFQSPSSASSSPDKPEQSPPPPDRRSDFLSSKPELKLDCLLFNTSFSQHYRGRIPKAPVLLDDPTTRTFHIPLFLVVANLGSSFENKLPAELKKELSERHLLGNEKVDIFWVVHSSLFLGEEVDHAGVPKTTRLAPHGWADPDAPGAYAGTRINRNFLLGVFESERDIQTPAFPANTMTASPIHTHDGLFSPRPDPGTNMLKVGSKDPSQSFWSLVIDANVPTDKIRAIATLHWIVTNEGENKLYNAFRKISHKRVKNPGKDYEDDAPNVETFGEFVEKLNNSEDFKSQPMLKKLNSLFH